MKYLAVIFDLDGTLLDTIEDLTDSMNLALGSLKFAPKTVAECKTLVGDGLATFIQRALPEAARGDPETARRLGEAMRAEYKKRNAVKTRPYPGIDAMLAALRERSVPAAILSNKPHPSTIEVVERFFPGYPFRMVLGAREGRGVKPDPEGALEIAAHLGLRPGSILYLGDTNTDMLTARAAGMFAVGALWGFRTAEELRAHGAQLLAAEPEEILTFL